MNRLLNKLSTLFLKAFNRIEYDKCYSSNEGYGAIFGMCDKCDDTNCPYYVNTKE